MGALVSYLLMLQKYIGSKLNCNTLNGLSNKVFVPIKTEDLNLNMLNMIAGVNESRALTISIILFRGSSLSELNLILIYFSS